MTKNYSFLAMAAICLVLSFTNVVFAQVESEADSLRRYIMDPLVITGTRFELEKSKIPSPITVIGREELEISNRSNVLPVLSYQVPGLFVGERSVMGFGVGPESAGGISMRGLSTSGDPANTRVLLLIDGQPQFMGIFGHPIADSYMSSDIERVEVIRGPASVLYGTNAMGGAINLITRKNEKDGMHLSASTAAGMFNTQQHNLHGGVKKGKFHFFTGGNYERTGGHRTDGTDNFKNATVFAKVKYDINDQLSLSADGNYSDSEFLDPGPESNPRIENNWYKFQRGRTAVSLDNSFKKVEGALRMFYNFGDHNFSNGFYSEDYNYGLTFYQNIQYTRGGVLTLGTDLKRFGGIAGNPNSPPAFQLLVDSAVSESDVYALIRQELGAVSLNGGYRIVNNSVFGTEHVPYAGLSIALDKHTTIKANASKGFRSPTLANLFVGGAANTELEPERMWNYELSFLRNFLDNHLNVELTGFIANGDNLIRQMPRVGGGPMQFINTGEFRHRGIEFSADYMLNRNLSFRLNYSHLYMERPQILAPENDLAFIANYRLKNLQLMLTSRYVQGLHLNTGQMPGAEVLKENYFLLNIQAAYQVLPSVQLFARMENLTDTRYYLQQGYIMPGIFLMGGLKFRVHSHE
ncbi:MAG: TonB-dependent receptor [Cyclobacteriaceae bacterium]|nr:TonB-dependent receptor [Cyclobacteriaceae bacterium]